MPRRASLLTLFPMILVLGCQGGDGGSSTSPPAPPPAAAPAVRDAATILTDVTAAMGATNLGSIAYSGTAWRVRNSFRQTRTASPPWPEHDEITNYRRALDLGRPASLALGDTFAQNLFLEPPVAGTYVQNVPPEQTAWAQQLEIWLTPWGFLRGAQDNGVESGNAVVDGLQYTVLSWQSPATQTSPSGLRYTVNGYVGADNLIARVETWVEDPFMGDMHVVQVYDGYRDVGGLMIPTTIEQRRGGGGIFGVSVTAATANPADIGTLLTPPATAPGGPGGGPPGPAAAPAELAQEIAEGVYLITGGYVALVAEFQDHLLVFEGGQSEERGRQIVDEVHRVFPGKPIRYVVNSHPHSDHTAGLVPLVRDGATIVTHASNVDFLRMALSTPRTLLGEETLEPKFEGVTGVGIYEDATMRVELHSVPNLHSDGTLVAFLPAQQILFQADFTLPREGATANPFVVTLAEYVDAAGLDFEHYLAVHAAQAPQTKANLLAAIGK